VDSSTEPAPEPVKAGKIKLRRKLTVEDAFVIIMEDGLDHFEANLPAALVTHDPEAIHQMHVAIRRLGVAARLFRPAMVSPKIDALVDEASDLAATLGAVRDLDVFRDDMLDPVIGHYGRIEGLRILGEVVQGRRIVAWANALAAARAPRVRAMIAEWRAALGERDWRGGERKGHKLKAKKFASEVLDHRARAVQKVATKIKCLSPRKRQKLRNRVGMLRDAAASFHSLFPKDEVRPYVKALRRLDESLDELAAVAMADDLLDRITGGSYSPKPLVRAEGLVLGWHGARADAAWPTTVKAWKKLMKKDPFWA
jgi:CHAD domain-containing protein